MARFTTLPPGKYPVAEKRPQQQRTATSAQALVLYAANEVGAVLLAETDQYRYRMQIKSGTSTRLYIVAQRKRDGVWCCSCAGWIGHSKGGPYWCKHLIPMRPALDRITQAERGMVR